MNQEQAIDYLKNIVITSEEPQHKNYKRVCSLAKFYETIITGEDSESLLVQFNKRQSDEDFKQMKDIYQTITPALADPVIKTYHKVFRVAPKIKEIDWEETESTNKNVEGDKKRKKEIESILNNFYGSKTIDYWLSNTFLHTSFIDPNAFILVQFEPFDNKTSKADPYPSIVPSRDAIDFSYTPKGILDYLLVKSQIKVVYKEPTGFKNIEKTAKRYILFIKDYSYVLTQIVSEYQTIPEGAIRLDTINNNNPYYLEEYAPKGGKVQAMRVGYITDPYTMDETYVSPLECARSWFMKTVKTVAELDLTQTFHVFPQKIEYVEACQIELTNGVCKTSGMKQTECTKCGGTGSLVQTSAQDIKVLKLPKFKEDMYDLEKMMIYKYPPVEIIKWMDEYIEKVSIKVQKTVFNSETFTRDKVAKTATGENLDMQNVYDTLTPFAQQTSSVWEFLVSITANFLDYGKGLIVKHAYPMDFKLKSQWELLMELKTTQESQAPGNIRQMITDDIMRNFLQDDKTGWIRYESKMKHYPFNGKTEKEIETAFANNLVSEDVKILWANFELIFQELEAEQEQLDPNIWFYDLTFELQTEKMNTKVQQYKTRIESETQTTKLFNNQAS